ncbi:MAG: SRPBCC family protein [Bacteroidota bacterium]
MTSLKSLIRFSLLAFVLLCVVPHFAKAQTKKQPKKKMAITTTQYIKASPAEVYAILIQLERFPEWSPFVVADPEQKNYVSGSNGELGSTFHWEGVADKSKGYQTLAKVNPNSYVRMECTIEKPYESQPLFEYHLREIDGGTEVTQAFEVRVSGFSNFMMKLFGVKKQMKAANALGMERLKALVEQDAHLTSR